MTTIRHGVTRFRITLVALAASYRSGDFQAGSYRRGRWVKPAKLGDFPSSTPQRRLAAALAESRQARLF